MLDTIYKIQDHMSTSLHELVRLYLVLCVRRMFVGSVQRYRTSEARCFKMCPFVASQRSTAPSCGIANGAATGRRVQNRATQLEGRRKMIMFGSMPAGMS